MIRTAPCIPVFFACDDKFAKYTAVSLFSLIKNEPQDTACTYKIHILNTGLSESSRQILTELTNERFSVLFEDVSDYLEKLSDRFPIRDYYSKSTYFRLIIADMFPDYDKAVYLDSDTIVRSSIRGLYDTDLTDDYLLAAAHEQAMVQNDIFGTYVETALGISRHNYFNAGVLLLNCRAMRDQQLLKRFADLLNFYEFKVTQDEDYLNVLCKDHVLWLDQRWNTELYGSVPYPIEEAKILHYIMTSKPWHYPEALAGDQFWQYAEQTSVFSDIKDELKAYTDDMRRQDAETCARLEQLALSETNRPDHYLARLRSKQDPDRVQILKKISMFESEKRFAEDVEDDPPTKPLLPDDIDYYHSGVIAHIKTKAAFAAARKVVVRLLANKQLIIREIRGIKNMSDLEGGAVVTCNHFNAFDSFAIQLAFEASGRKDKKFYRVIREGNYTSFPGFYGFLMRNCNTLPLSSNVRTMMKFTEATGTLLKKGNLVLVYPEQSMWWNYRKPKPLQTGAFTLAVRNQVPVLPCFITMRDSAVIGEDGFPVQEYTIHISGPLYPDMSLPYAKCVQDLMNRNFEVWKNIYETEYQLPLTYYSESAGGIG